VTVTRGWDAEIGGAELAPGRLTVDAAPVRLMVREEALLGPRRPDGDAAAEEVVERAEEVSEPAPAVSADATAE